ncbi:MAG: hypothetical protein ACLPQS_09910 [Acidimicrobiales bacterium]
MPQLDDLFGSSFGGVTPAGRVDHVPNSLQNQEPLPCHGTLQYFASTRDCFRSDGTRIAVHDADSFPLLFS